VPLGGICYWAALYTSPLRIPPVGLREQKKLQTRAALLTEANARFAAQGFEATTIDELCDAVGISKRTFFRYFPGKEDLVFPNHEERLARFLEFLDLAPAGERAFDTLRRATQVFAYDYMSHRDRFIGQQKLIRTSATLMAREHEIDRAWERAMAAWFVDRLGAGHPDPALDARVMAGAAIGVIRATMRHWYDNEGAVDLEALGRSALDRLERGFMG